MRIIPKLILSIMLAGGGMTASAGTFSGLQEVETVTPSVIEEVELTVIQVPQDVVPEIHESKIARKMTQAEKAENARVNDSWGGAITIIAMCIVILALAVLSILFMGFGKISEILLTRTKKRAKAAADHVHDESHHELATGETIAAISLALTEHFAEGHDIEDTILTIRRMKKAYSPWNSKIYNLRSVPEHASNPQQLSALTKR